MLDAKRRNEYAGLINDSGHHLLAVVNGILDMSKIETDNFEITPEPFAPAHGDQRLLRSSGASARAMPASASKIRAADDLPEMIADKRALNQILLNLLSNAIRFTDRGGKVTSAPAPRRRPSSLQSRITASASATRIWRASASRIFRRVPRTIAAMAAPVLAFPSSKAWCGCTAANSSIRSRVGDGTRVTVRLPLDCERARPARKQSPAGCVSATNPVASKVTAYPMSAVATREAPPRAEIMVKKSA